MKRTVLFCALFMRCWSLCRVYVGSIVYDLAESDIMAIFQAFGQIRVRLIPSLRLASCDLRLASCELRLATCDLRRDLDGYEWCVTCD